MSFRLSPNHYFHDSKFDTNLAASWDRPTDVAHRDEVIFSCPWKSSKEANLDFEELKAVRCMKAAPVLKGLGLWMQQQYVQVLPKSAIGKALAYSLERWDKLSLYITDGRLKIDNNPVENSIRPVALGRKNYLFAGSHEAAKRSGMLYSLLGTCKMHGVEPYAWLKDILQRIADHPINKIQDLLPHRYKG